jgi:hypothetical protein
MQEVVPGVYLGSAVAMESALPDLRPGDLVVDCTGGGGCADAGSALRSLPEGVRTLRVAEITADALRGSAAEVRRTLASDARARAFVYCGMGQQRSPAVVAALIAEAYPVTAEEAVAAVRTRKRDAFFGEASFLPALQALARGR